MSQRLKLIVLHVAKGLGLFHITKKLTQKGLRILCYHGFELADETTFRPKLFIKPKTFQQRMAKLAQGAFQVLPLSDALGQLQRGTLPACAVAITVDDGFYSTKSIAAPIMKRYNFSATIYITTYYVLKQTPIFRLVVQYMFWRTSENYLALPSTNLTEFNSPIDLGSKAARNKAIAEIIRVGETQYSDIERQELLRTLGEALRVDFSHIESIRSLSLMSENEIRDLLAQGFDIQLHTHRHTFPPSEPLVGKREIEQNREVLEFIAGQSLHHFCYPSGEWSPIVWPLLNELAIESATTCEAGLNYQDTPALGLKRFLDGENISAIEFEAELYGFLEVTRRLRSIFSFAQNKVTTATA